MPTRLKHVISIVLVLAFLGWTWMFFMAAKPWSIQTGNETLAVFQFTVALLAWLAVGAFFTISRADQEERWLLTAEVIVSILPVIMMVLVLVENAQGYIVQMEPKLYIAWIALMIAVINFIYDLSMAVFASGTVPRAHL